MRGRLLVDTKRSRRIRRIFGEAPNDELSVAATGILYRSHEVNEAVGSFAHRLSVWSIDRDPINENGAQIAIFRRSLCRDIERSEERRVGKEGRSGWSWWHLYKWLCVG